MQDTSPTTCYRHPDRPTGIGCQRCNRLICSECMVPAPVGFHCPVCVASAAAAAPRVLQVRAGTPYVTYAIITANVLVAIAGLATNSGWVQGNLGTIGIRGGLLGGGLTREHGLPVLIGIDFGEWYRIITGAFIHSGPIHLGFNMLILWQMGSLLEPTLGRLRFSLLYLVGLLGGSFGALLVAPDTVTVGASGAVFGLMAALFLAEKKGMIGLRGGSVGFLILINLVLTVAIPGISIGGHLGGLIAGGATAWVFLEYSKRKLPPLLPIAISVGLSVVLFAASLWAAAQWRNPLL